MAKGRNYRREYDTYHAKPEQKKNRAERNRARRKAKRSGANLAGKDVGHVTPLKNGKTSKTRLQSIKSNRAHGGSLSSTKGMKYKTRKR